MVRTLIRHFLALTLLIALAATSGCVPKKKHLQTQADAAKREAALQEQLEGERTRGQAALAAEQAKSAELQARVEALEAELAKAREDIAALEKDREKLQTDLAAMVADKSSLQGSVDEMKRALDELARRKAESDARVAEFRKLLERFKALIDAGKLKVKIVDGRMVVTLATDVLFASGQASLSKEGVTAVQEVSQVLASIPGRKFQVEGHTDNVPIKTAQFPSNWELASARSITVVKTMIEAGMPADRISAASFGESRPVAKNTTAEGRTSNRRIEIVLVPDLSSLPGFDELNRAAGRATPSSP